MFLFKMFFCLLSFDLMNGSLSLSFDLTGLRSEWVEWDYCWSFCVSCRVFELLIELEHETYEEYGKKFALLKSFWIRKRNIYL